MLILTELGVHRLNRETDAEARTIRLSDIKTVVPIDQLSRGAKSPRLRP
jgi:hypothetical protein